MQVGFLLCRKGLRGGLLEVEHFFFVRFYVLMDDLVAEKAILSVF